MIQTNTLEKKLRTDKICENCHHHTIQKKIKIRGKEIWICNECGLVQEMDKLND